MDDLDMLALIAATEVLESDGASDASTLEAARQVMSMAPTAICSLMVSALGARNRRRMAHKGDEVAEYLISAGRELVQKCEDLYERSGELMEDTARELSNKYRALHEYSKHTVDEAEVILRRRTAVVRG
jgi:hypothetical protein